MRNNLLKHFFRPNYAPVYVPIALSFIGTLLYLLTNKLPLWLHDHWSLTYFLLAPFVHVGVMHFFLNALALHYIGGMLMLPTLGARRFLLVFTGGIVIATIANNLLAEIPAVGISAGIMALLACALYPYGRLPMKLLLIHDLLRLRPFPLHYIAAFIVCLDIAGIIFGWHFFAHWAHLAGFATGGGLGFYFFRRNPPPRHWLH